MHRSFVRALLPALILAAVALAPPATAQGQLQRPASQGNQPSHTGIDLADLVYDRTVDASAGPTPKINPDSPAAVGVNRKFDAGKAKFPLFYKQSIGGVYVQIGVVRRVDPLRQYGWRVLDYGFRFQQPDGSSEGKFGVVLGTAFMIDAAARSLLIERQLGISSGDEQYLPKIVNGAKWLASLDPRRDPAIRKFSEYTHRNWVMASALSLTAELTGDESLRKSAQYYIELGLAAQRPDGVNPERGGFDVGYQSAGMIRATHVLTVTKDPALRDRITKNLNLANDWLVGRVKPDGDINSTGSTRVGVDPALAGGKKRIPYKGIAEALAYGGVVLARSDLRQAAEKVIASDGFREYVRPSKKEAAKELEPADAGDRE